MSAGKCGEFRAPASPERSPRTACDPETKLAVAEGGGGSGDITQNASHQVQQNISLVHLYLQGPGHFSFGFFYRILGFSGSGWQGTGGGSGINGGNLKGWSCGCFQHLHAFWPVLFIHANRNAHLVSLPPIIHTHNENTQKDFMEIWRCVLYTAGHFLLSPSFPNSLFSSKVFSVGTWKMHEEEKGHGGKKSFRWQHKREW